MAPGTVRQPDEVHARQHYELVSWRRGDSDLNYRRFFTVTTLAGVRVEVPEVFAATHTRGPPLVRRGPRRRLAHRPPRRPARPGGVPRPPRRPHLGRLHADREDPRDRRGAPAWLGDGRHHGVRRARTARPRAHRPVGRAAADRPRPPVARRRPGLARAGPRPQARRGRRQPAGRDPAHRPRAPRPAAAPPRAARGRGGRGAGVLPGLPLLPARRSRPPRPGTRTPHARRDPTSTAVLDDLALGAGRPGGSRSAALPADQRDGDGQGRRGQRVLPHLAAHLAQRGRR